jgi:membrane fusion protein, multidrug efflux system
MERHTRTRRLSLALAAALAAACSGRAEKAALPPAGAAARAVRVIRPAATIETGLARSTGTIRAREDAVLSAKATGQIRRIRAEVGDRVKAGAVLAEMDGTNAQISLQNARALERLAVARLAEAERGLTRSKVLFEGEGMAQAKYEEVQTGREMAAAQLDQARAMVKQAEQAVRDSTVVAPFGGIVTGRFRNAGDTVTMMPVSPIVALTDVDHLEVRLSVPEALEPAIAVGQLVEGTTTPGGQRFHAKVRVKNAVVELATRTIEVLADVVKAEGSASSPSVDGLRPGTLVTVDFGRFGEGGGVFVPSTAVKTDGKASWVMVVAGGKAERRDVLVNPVHPGTVVVKQGLAPEADVIVDPGGLEAGAAVSPLVD